MKKAQGLSLNMIIIAILALLILAIIVFLVAKSAMRTAKGTETPKCVSGKNFFNCNPAEGYVWGTGEDSNGKIVKCCIPFKSLNNKD